MYNPFIPFILLLPILLLMVLSLMLISKVITLAINQIQSAIEADKNNVAVAYTQMSAIWEQT